MKRIYTAILILLLAFTAPAWAGISLSQRGGADLLTTGANGDSTTTSSDSGLELINNFLTLIRGCSDGEVLHWIEATDTWDCGADSTGAGSLGSEFTSSTNDLLSSHAVTGAIILGATGLTNNEKLTLDFETTPDEVGVSSTTSVGNINFGAITLETSGGLIGPVTGNADTATALAANGANCSAGQAPLGVDASGAVEGCIDLPNTYQPLDADLTTIAGLTATTGNVLISVASAWASVAQPSIDCTNCTLPAHASAHQDGGADEIAVTSGMMNHDFGFFTCNGATGGCTEDTPELPLAGGTLTGELKAAAAGIEFTATDTLTDCSTFAATGGGIFYDDSEGKFKKCQDNTLTDLDTSGSGTLGSNLSSSTFDILSDTGSIQLGSSVVGQEKISLDFSSANTVNVTTSTGVTVVDFGAIAVYAGSFLADPSTSPALPFDDSDDAGSVDAQIAVNCATANDCTMGLGVDSGSDTLDYHFQIITADSGVSTYYFGASASLGTAPSDGISITEGGVMAVVGGGTIAATTAAVASEVTCAACVDISGETNLAGTANEVELSGDTLILSDTVNLGAHSSFEIPNGAVPTTDAFGEIAGDNNAWAASRGAVQWFDGTANTYLVGILAADTCTDGQIPKIAMPAGTWSCEDDSTGSGSLGSELTSSTNDILSSHAVTGAIILGATGLTNNGTLTWDFETTAATVGVSGGGTTPVTTVDFGTLAVGVGSLDVSDNNITNVGDIALDSISADLTNISIVAASGTVTVESIVFTGNALSAVGSISDGTAQWSSSALSGFTSISTTGQYTGGTKPTIKTTAGSYTLGTTSANESYGGVVYMTSSGTLSLPAIAAGMNFTLIAVGAVTATIDPNGSEVIIRDGTTQSAGVTIVGTGATGDMAVCVYNAASTWYCSTGSNAGTLWAAGA